MFELINEDLEDCIEILRQMTQATSTEQYQILAENGINKKDIEKTIALCELLVYHYNKLEEHND